MFELSTCYSKWESCWKNSTYLITEDDALLGVGVSMSSTHVNSVLVYHENKSQYHKLHVGSIALELGSRFVVSLATRNSFYQIFYWSESLILMKFKKITVIYIP